MIENPWVRLPDKPPFVLDEDRKAVQDFNKTCNLKARPNLELHIGEILPEPFVGDKDAPVVLLSNNPGFGEGALPKRDPAFMARLRNNLAHGPADYPFLFLAPEFGGPGKTWWERKLKCLLKRFEREVVARSILNVVYFPYPSRRFGHRRLRLASRQYSFHLVKEAVNRGAVIVFMRREDMWQEAVPELKDYDRHSIFKVINTQNPVISPKNCPQGFENVVKAIETAEAKRRNP